MARLIPNRGTLHEEIPYFRIHRDDIEDVIELMRTTGLEVSIRDATHEYTDLDELVQMVGQRPKQVYLRAATNNDLREIDVALHRDHILVYSSHPEKLGVLPHQLLKRLTALRASYARFLNPGPWAAAIGLFLLFQPSFALSMEWLPTIGLVGGPVLLLMSAAHFGFRGIRLRRRHEGGFFRRNADHIWLLVIGAALGAAATWVIALLTGKC